MKSVYLQLQALCMICLAVNASTVSAKTPSLLAVEQSHAKASCEKKSEAGQYSEALAFCEKALKLAESVYGPEHRQVADALHDLGIVFDAQGQYADAEAHCTRALAMRQKFLGPEHRDVAASLTCLGTVSDSQAQYARAHDYYSQALVMNRKLLGNLSRPVANNLENLASIHAAQGHYLQANELFEQSLEIAKKVLGTEHSDVATVMNNMAINYRKQGRLAQAERLYRQALHIKQKTVGQDHADIAFLLHNLSGVMDVQGHYVQAELLAQRALELQTKHLGKENPAIANSMNNLALILTRHGQYERAENLHFKALELRKKILGPEHPDTLDSINNIAIVFEKQGRPEKALAMHQEVLRVRKHVLGDEHATTALSMNNIASCLIAIGDYRQAQEMAEKALELLKKKQGPDDPDLASAMQNLAVTHFRQGQHEKSESLHQQVLEMRRRKLGAAHPKVAASLRNLATQYLIKGDGEKALQALTECGQIREAQLRITASEARMQSLVQQLRDDEDLIYGLLLDPKFEPLFRRLAVTTALLRKGRVQESGALVNQYTHKNLNHSVTQKYFEELQSIRQNREALFYGGPGKSSLEEYQSKLIELNFQAQKLAAQLSATLPDLDRITPPDFKDIVSAVAKRLPAGSVLVEFLWQRSYQANVTERKERWGSPHYQALLLFPDQRLVAVDLGSAAELEQRSHELLAALQNPGSDPKGPAQALHDLVFAPLLPHLAGVTELFVSPDGVLSVVPFSALHDGTQYLIDRYRFQYLTSGRDLLHRPSRRPAQPPVVLAAPDFGRRDTAAADDAGGLYDQLASLPPLPGTQREGEQLGALLGVVPLLSTAATEAAVRRATAPQILHIATHGFMLQDVQRPALPAERSSLLLAPSQGVVKKEALPTTTSGWSSGMPGVMSRTGLVLAGARQRQFETSTMQDGLLTAEEAQSLDLDGTQLVVLSACDTGQGALATGQGVYGLRRAFLVAGAETVVTSLWRVNDEATLELMTAYYRKLLSPGQPGDRHGAMLDAMQELRRRPGREHPYYWAPFIVIGQGGPLRGRGAKAAAPN